MANIPSDYNNIFEKKMTLSEGQQIDTLVSVIGYFTLIGWVVAMIIYDKHQSSLASFHLRQSLGLILTGALLSLIPLIGWFLAIGVFFAWFIGLYGATQGRETKVPLLGDIYQEYLDFIK